ncbi:MAG: ROK family glucokinase [Actinomycetales bacterium]
MTLTVGVDVGGTKVLAGVVRDGEILLRVRRDTPADNGPALVDAISDAVAECRAVHPDVRAVGISAAGFIDAARGVVLFAPNRAWRDEPLRQELELRAELPVVVENDANAAAWGEFVHGAGRDVEDMVCITVGTGLGGGVVLDGRLLHGRWGIAAEIGHVRMVPQGRLCGCGQHGCAEQYVSGRALVRAAQELAALQPERAGRLLALGAGTPRGRTGPAVAAAATAGAAVAREAFEVIGGWLGQVCADLAAVLDPEVFVIGGGVSEAGDLLLAPARRSYEAALSGTGHRPLATLRPAELGNDAGLAGAADLARAAAGAVQVEVR